MEYLVTFPKDKRQANGQRKMLRMLVLSWEKAKPIACRTKGKYGARKRTRNDGFARLRANNKSTRYAWGVYRRFRLV